MGRSVIVVDAARHVVVGDPRFGLAPGGINLLGTEFARFAAAVRSGDAIALDHWSPATVDLADLRVRPRPVHPIPADLLPEVPGADAGHPMSPVRIRSRATLVAAGHGAALRAALSELIGAGPGSTPSGDDVLVGVMAGLRAAGDRDRSARIGAAVEPLLHRTTRASALYLRAAADGRFADRVHELLGGLASAGAAATAVQRAASWGATSGLDLLAGICAGASHGTVEAAA